MDKQADRKKRKYHANIVIESKEFKIGVVMGRRHEAAKWLQKGYSPSKIAQKMGVTVSTVIGYLYNQVGEGNIRRSDIVFAIDEELRDRVEDILSKKKSASSYDMYYKMKRSGEAVDIDELKIYLKLRDARVVFGDMYEFMREIEMNLHRIIKSTLRDEYHSKWWRKGVPETIRAECAVLREKDPVPAVNKYSYTSLIHLKEILDSQWSVFVKALPKKLTSNKRETLKRLEKLNRIRNAVMHPIKGVELTDKDFAFIRDFRSDFNL